MYQTNHEHYIVGHAKGGFLTEKKKKKKNVVGEETQNVEGKVSASISEEDDRFHGD